MEKKGIHPNPVSKVRLALSSLGPMRGRHACTAEESWAWLPQDPLCSGGFGRLTPFFGSYRAFSAPPRMMTHPGELFPEPVNRELEAHTLPGFSSPGPTLSD